MAPRCSTDASFRVPPPLSLRGNGLLPRTHSHCAVCSYLPLQSLSKTTQHPAVQLLLPLSMPASGVQTYQFGPIKLSSSQVFLRSSLSYAFVNLKPIVPGAGPSTPSAMSCAMPVGPCSHSTAHRSLHSACKCMQPWLHDSVKHRACCSPHTIPRPPVHVPAVLLFRGLLLVLVLGLMPASLRHCT